MRSSAIVALMLWPLAVVADAIPGADAPAFQQARAQWLAGDDLPALTALSDLAHADNRAAQLLLGQIASDQALFAHVTDTMTRAERRALLRAPGGLSGTSWLEVAAEAGDPLAQALVQAKAPARAVPGPVTDAIETLATLGEPVLAARLVQNPGFFSAEATRWQADFVTRHQSQLPPGTMVAVLRTAGQAQLAPDSLWLESGGLVETLLSGRPQIAADRLTSLAPDIAGWAPLYAYCRAHCPDDPASCTIAGAMTQTDIAPFSSPLESLISNDDYHKSARITADVLRRVTFPDLLMAPGENGFLEQMDACMHGRMWEQAGH